MSTGEARKLSDRDIQMVQNLIEQCIQMHMNRDEAVDTLWSQAKIEHHFTELVWQKLEEENREFFEAYNLRLALKSHIVMFNDLLKKQVLLMKQVHSAGVPTLPASNGSHITQFQQNSGCYAMEAAARTESLKQESFDPALTPGLTYPFSNGVSPVHGSLNTAVRLSGPSGRIDVNMFASQSSDMRMMQEMNGGGEGIIKPENDDYSSSSPFMFGSNAPVPEMRQTMGDESAASYNALDPSSQSLFPDILESYLRSPFLGEDSFADSRQGGELPEESRKLESMSEGFSYQDFGSE